MPVRVLFRPRTQPVPGFSDQADSELHHAGAGVSGCLRLAAELEGMAVFPVAEQQRRGWVELEVAEGGIHVVAGVLGPAEPEALAEINRAAAAAPCWPGLGRDLVAGVRTAAPAAVAVRAEIARDAIDLFGGPDRTELRRCARPGCVLYFVKDHPRRQWCSPERAAAAADGVRLAVTAVLQALPPRQRGVFILRDVLGHPAAETAAILELSVTAVNSALQRARAAVRGGASRPAPLRRETVEDYARAIERADAAALATLVAADVLFEMPPVPQWSTGREAYAAFMAHLFAWRGTRWATRPISANGQPGILLSLVTDAGRQPHSVQLFEADDAGPAIGHVLVYQDPRLFALFEKSLVADR